MFVYNIAVKAQMNLRVRTYSRGLRGGGACSPETKLISRSSVVCFGVYSTTVSLNDFTKFSLDLHDFFNV